MFSHDIRVSTVVNKIDHYNINPNIQLTMSFSFVMASGIFERKIICADLQLHVYSCIVVEYPIIRERVQLPVYPCHIVEPVSSQDLDFHRYMSWSVS